MCGIFGRRKDEDRRFETEGGRNFFLGNELLSFHSIQLGSLLPLNPQIMGHEVSFGSRDGDESKNFFLGFNTCITALESQSMLETTICAQI